MLLLLIYVKSLLQNALFFIFLLKTFGSYIFLFYLCTRFQEMPPCGFFFSGFVLWKDLHIQRSSTRSVCRIFDVGRWVKKRPIIFLDFGVLNLILRMKVLSRDKWSASPRCHGMGFPLLRWRVFVIAFSLYDFLQWRVWSWLRMNASYRLNTCKSRGNGIMCLHILDVDRRTGEYRVSNLPSTRGYPVERRPNTRCCPQMASDVDQRFIGGGWGCVWLACWCG